MFSADLGTRSAHLKNWGQHIFPTSRCISSHSLERIAIIHQHLEGHVQAQNHIRQRIENDSMLSHPGRPLTLLARETGLPATPPSSVHGQQPAFFQQYAFCDSYHMPLIYSLVTHSNRTGRGKHPSCHRNSEESAPYSEHHIRHSIHCSAV